VPGELQRAMEPISWTSPDGDPWRAVLATSTGSRKWRRHVLRRGDGSAVPVRVSRRPIPGDRGVDGEATYVMEDATRAPDALLRGAFLAMVGHELRTPITSIVAGAELLHGMHLDADTHAEVATLLVEEAHRVHILVEQLTALTLLQSGGASIASEPVHLLHLARRVGVREAARRSNMDLRVPHLDSSATIALGDEGFIGQVLTILIDNAAKYGEPTRGVELVVRPAGSEVAVHVLDRGPGLQGADPDELFRLFQRADHDRQVAGSGIGLYVASQIVVAMGGRIWAQDRDGGGADFGFALPAVR
jgi:K+-sensing histidine kinase KdpD